MGVTMTWSVKPTKSWIPEWDRRINFIRRDIIRLIASMLDEIEQWMRENAPWNDRTLEERMRDARLDFSQVENARQSLRADLVMSANNMYVQLSYGDGVYYSWALEYAMGSRFEILAPTMDHWTPIIAARITALLKTKYKIS